MKQYLIFAWDQYYPGGGSSDLQGTADTYEETKKMVQAIKLKFDYYQIFDQINGIWGGLETMDDLDNATDD